MLLTGTKGSTFSPCWYYQPGVKKPLVPGAKNAETNVKLGYRSKVCSLVVHEKWKVLRGDSTAANDLLFTVKKTSIFQLKTKLDVFLAGNTTAAAGM